MPITIATQLHGYQQGHQLLASTIKLARQDQSIIDRLSDVAGPLRPAEKFKPYLSAYPLPSGKFFILARTWQDLTVPRAGCVRTLSLVIPLEVWSRAKAVLPLVGFLDAAGFPSVATSFEFDADEPIPLPSVRDFQGSELLEALFLEDAKPVAMFDAPEPELITIRLLTALWPAIRGRFAVSTFALSPRKIEGRSFDLVFAPKDARSRFAEWGGRRIDALGARTARHRWTGAIVDRVFEATAPSLLDDRYLGLISREETNKPAALRIALLWDELTAKVEHSPSAALGLLDIANSKSDGDLTAFFALQPVLVKATELATRTMASNEAWDFLGAISKKMHRFPAVATLSSVAHAAEGLARLHPSEAVRFLSRPDPDGALSNLLPSIASGIGSNFNRAAEKALFEANAEVFARLLTSNTELSRLVVDSPILVRHLGDILGVASPSTLASVREILLPVLVEDRHAIAAAPLIQSLDAEDLFDEVRLLSKVNDFAAGALVKLILDHARNLGAMDGLRDVLIKMKASPARNAFLEDTFSVDLSDVKQLTEDNRYEKIAASALPAILRRANAEQLGAVFAEKGLATSIVRRLPSDSIDILWRALAEANLSLPVQLIFSTRLLVEGRPKDRTRLALGLLQQIIRVSFDGDEISVISQLLNILGNELDGSQIVRQGVDRHLSNAIVARNLASFNLASTPARNQILSAINQLAAQLADRYTLDLDEAGIKAVTSLFLDSRETRNDTFLSAAARILPTLLRSRYAPVSTLIAATFPPIYRELAKEDDGPEFLKFIPFMDWDRCKSARRELVDAFLMSRVWEPRDIAVAACRSNDTWKILRKVAKSYGGQQYFERIAMEIPNIPEPCATEIRHTIDAIYADWPSRYDWRD